MNNLTELERRITGEIAAQRNAEMADLIASAREREKRAQERYQGALKAFEAMGLKVASLQALELEASATAEKELEGIEARMVAMSKDPGIVTTDAGVDASFVPSEARVLMPHWAAAFSSNDLSSSLTSAKSVTTQDLITGGGCKKYYNWASGAGSGLFGTGAGEIQSWVEFGFWYLPPVSRFYSIAPLFRYRGFYIVRADDGIFTSKYARVVGSAWVNVYQYNWKGWNSVNVYDVGDDNIDVNRRFDADRYLYTSYLLGGGDWAWIRCTIGLYAYARGGGSYARNDFDAGVANFLCVPWCYVY